MSRLALLAASLLALSSCAAWRRSHSHAPPERPVAVTALHLLQGSLDRADFGLQLAVQNPHGARGALRSVTWELWLDGRWFASGTQDVQGALAGRATLPLSLTLETAFPRAVPAKSLSVVPAGIRGNVRVDFPTGEEQLTFSRLLPVDVQGTPLLPATEEAAP